MRWLLRHWGKHPPRVRDEMGPATRYQSQCGAYTAPWWTEVTVPQQPVLTLGQQTGYGMGWLSGSCGEAR